MSNIDKQALRTAAENATPGEWCTDDYHGVIADAGLNANYYIASCSGPDNRSNKRFIAAANPATVLALLDELEAKDNRINRLEAIVAVAEQRNALMRDCKRALKVPCDLVDNQVPVVIHGMVIRLERLKETEDKLTAAEKRIAELSSVVIAPGVMRCAGCGFVLTKNNISMSAGTITAGDSKTEPCPNGCGPLWPVTWKEQAIQFRDDSEQWFDELQEARQRIAGLEKSHAQVIQARDHYKRMFEEGFRRINKGINLSINGEG